MAEFYAHFSTLSAVFSFRQYKAKPRIWIKSENQEIAKSDVSQTGLARHSEFG
jgi:hypothetical protein